jgi:glycine/D-amino acid oxidase-like deaminating enzyme
MTAEIFAPDFTATPYWWEAARPTAEGGSPLPATADVAVVGSGYAGLSAALELVRGGVRVVVLDQRELGGGASTINGGFVSGGTKLPDDLAQRFGAARARAIFEAADESVVHVEALIEREAIACHYAQAGRFIGAHSPRHYAWLARRADVLTRTTGTRCEMVPRARQHEEIASAFYHGGLVLDRAGALHPALFHAGLLAAVRRAGAILCPRTTVRAIVRTGRGFAVETSAGRLAATEVVVATNGYTGPATPYLQRRVIPVASHMIATEELPASTAGALIPRGRLVSDTKRILYYFRLSPDGHRLLFGGRASFRAIDPRASAVRLYEFMCGVFPQLRGVRLTHAWLGNVAFTFDRLPHMGVHEGVYYCLGCNGTGVAMATYLGHRTALRVLGAPAPACPFDGLPFPTRPLYRGSPWFLPVVGAYYRLRDRFELASPSPASGTG